VGSAFFLANDFETFSTNSSFVRDLFSWRARGLQFSRASPRRTWRTCAETKFNQAANFIIGHEHALCANQSRSARREIKLSPWPKQSIGAVFIEITRLSIRLSRLTQIRLAIISMKTAPIDCLARATSLFSPAEHFAIDSRTRRARDR